MLIDAELLILHAVVAVITGDVVANGDLERIATTTTAADA